MKRIISYVLLVAVLVVATGCATRRASTTVKTTTIHQGEPVVE